MTPEWDDFSNAPDCPDDDELQRRIASLEQEVDGWKHKLNLLSGDYDALEQERDELRAALKWCADTLEEMGVSFAPADELLAHTEGE